LDFKTRRLLWSNDRSEKMAPWKYFDVVLTFRAKNNQLEVRICKANCSDPETPCVQKCCSQNEVYSLGMNGKRGGCLPLDSKSKDTPWAPVFYETLNQKLSPEESRKLKPHLIHKNPTSFKALCRNRVTIVYPFGQTISNFLSSVLRRPFSHLE
jgi:hypothetical protein